MTCSCLMFIATLPLLTNGFAINKRITTIPSSQATISSRNIISSSSSLYVAGSEIDETSELPSDNNDNELPLTYLELVNLPRHPANEAANTILTATEKAIRSMQKCELYNDKVSANIEQPEEETLLMETESVYANSYVDLSKVSTIGFDYDYTLVTYTQELLGLIYDMALRRLVEEKEYPREMLESGLRFDPFFSIRGLAVDRENGWICHLSYTHKVASAWEGRHRVSRPNLMAEYSGKRALSPSERKRRLKPLNDLFSMAECCLMADTVQFFLDRDIPFCPRSAVNDVLGSITNTHISGDFHKLVAQEPEKYFEEKPHLKQVLDGMKDAGKRLIFVSNSPFWYCDAGMNYVVGPDWRDQWDVVITSAGKPAFYTEDNRPFREVDIGTGKLKFRQVLKLEKGRVYTAGCLKELTQCINWSHPLSSSSDQDDIPYDDIYSPLTSPNVMYVGDSLFADLVDAKREFGWTTAAVTPEVGWEIELQRKTEFRVAGRAIEMLLNSLRLYQRQLGTGLRSKEDLEVMDKMERLVSSWRDEQTRLLGNSFGSVFRARYQPSLFAHSLRRYCDLYMSNVGSLRHYSPQHRFYPESPKLLSHEIRGSNPECCDIDDDIFLDFDC
uniref:5'-nucleotidase n=1 Tax=Skeletonema marinoi TaxID=267567 RepID=A0A7S2L6K9_9STRA